MQVPITVLRTARNVLPVTGSGLALLLVAAALPDLAGLALVAAAGTAVLLLCCGVCAGVTCRVLAAGRSPTATEDALLAGATTLACRAGLGPPLVHVRVQPRDAGVVPYAGGPGIVMIPRGLVVALHQGRIGPLEAAAGLCHAGATCRAGLVTRTAALTLWCLPWTVAASFVTGLARGLKSRPLLELVWACRLVVPTIAMVQLSGDGHLLMAAVVAAIASGSYAQPALSRWHSARVEAVADRDVVALGLGAPYARLLTAGGHPIGLERHVALTAAPDPARRRDHAGMGVLQR